MKHLSVMIKPASSLCNMRCRYCFYADVSRARDVASYGVMTDETTRALVATVYRDLEDGDHITFAFQGGEPTLAGLAFFKRFVEAVKQQQAKAKVSWALQTNGILLDNDWCEFLKRNRFLVGLSLDCNGALHNTNRLDEKGHGSFSRVMAAKRLMDKCQVDYNVLCVLTNEAALHPQKIWKFILNENIRYVQFIPCLDDLDSSAENALALTPKRFHSFYSALFPLWQKQVEQGNYISVKLFDDIAHLFVHGQVTSCGLHGRCAPQSVIEADGGIFPCDFYVLDQYWLGDIQTTTLRQAFEKTEETGFLDSRKHPPQACAKCRYQRMCGGGCKRMEQSVYVDQTGFCGYQHLLDDRLEALCATARQLAGGC